jgi:hypothetical protein
VFSKEATDLIYGMSRCLVRLGALPETLVWDREGAIHAGSGLKPPSITEIASERRDEPASEHAPVIADFDLD